MFYLLAYIAGIITLPILVFIFDRKEQMFLVRAKHKNGVQNERRFTDLDYAEEWLNGLRSHGDYMDVELSAVIETPATAQRENDEMRDRHIKATQPEKVTSK